jgi:branched-chain amino acid transport system ATP-binding protein
MLSISKLQSGYEEQLVLKGVDIEIQAGEIVALIGPNGAGKSTVLKSIFSLANVSSGRIVFRDRDITKLKTHELIELGVAFVPQGRQVFSTMTVLENLYMGAYVMKDEDIIQKNIDDIFKKFSILEEKKNDNASTLSGGQQQILAIARALIQKPQLLLMDEPSLGLSPKAMQEIFDKIVEIKNEGVAILLVEQNAYQAVSIADRTYVLESGKVALTGGRDILNDQKINEVYLGGRI